MCFGKTLLYSDWLSLVCHWSKLCPYIGWGGSSKPVKLRNLSALCINERWQIISNSAHKWHADSLPNVLNRWILQSCLLPGQSWSLQAVLRGASFVHFWSILWINSSSQSCLGKKQEWDRKEAWNTVQLMEGLVLNILSILWLKNTVPATIYGRLEHISK